MFVPVMEVREGITQVRVSCAMRSQLDEEEREKKPRTMCKGPVVRGEYGTFWDGEKASVPIVSGI